jgi:hypothetical protein
MAGRHYARVKAGGLQGGLYEGICIIAALWQLKVKWHAVLKYPIQRWVIPFTPYLKVICWVCQ